MAKYMVVVNKKYIVRVESTSNGGAEHVILDNFVGIKYAQAFDAKELATDTFAYFLDTCSTISLDELKQLSDDFAKARESVEAARETLRENVRKMEDAKRAYELAKENVQICEWNVKQAQDVANGYGYGIGYGYEEA